MEEDSECLHSMEQRPMGSSLTDVHMHLTAGFHLMRGITRPRAAELGLGPGQPRVLSYVAVHEGCTQREVADYFGIDASAVSRMVEGLIRGGFVEPAEQRDRRSKTLKLTEHGRAAMRSWDETCAEVDAIMLAGLSEQECQTLDRLLTRVRKNLLQAVSGNTEAEDE